MRHAHRRTATLLLFAAGLMAGSLDCGRSKHVTAPGETSYGTLEVRSDPAGAKILVDGADYGSITPDDFTLSAGMHRVAVSLAGHVFAPANTTLAVPAEGTVTYTFLEFAPRLVPDALAHDFGQQALGTSSPNWCFNVTNAGRAVADSGSFALSGADSAQYAIVSGGKWRALAPGGSQQVCVAFRPSGAGARRATLRVGDAAVALTGTGYKVPCALAPGATSHDFGQQLAGQASGSWCFTITNDDAAACSDTLHVSGANPGEFVIVSGAAYALAPGASQQVCVAFTPSVAGARSASLVVGTTPVSLSGTGTGSCAIGAPSAVDGTAFGAVCLDVGASKRLVVPNSGNLACTLTASTCAPLAVSPASASVPPGGSATFTVSFQPTVVGASPSCPVTLSDGTSQWPTLYSGTGVSVPVVDFTPSSGIAGHAGDPILFVPGVQPNGSAVTSYAWDFGDGGSSTAAQPTHRYSAGGTYTVSLTATNACGSSPVATHAVCVDEPAYVLLYHFDSSTVPDYVTNIPGWGTSVPLVLYRGTNATYGALPSVVCANVFTGERLDTGHDPITGQVLAANEALGTTGQSFATAHLPLGGTECTVTTDLTMGAIMWSSSGPTLYLKVGACPHQTMGIVSGDPRYCLDFFNTTHCPSGGDARLEWGLEPLSLARWCSVNAVKFTFDCWYVCPGGAPQTGPMRVVNAH